MMQTYYDNDDKDDDYMIIVTTTKTMTLWRGREDGDEDNTDSLYRQRLLFQMWLEDVRYLLIFVIIFTTFTIFLTNHFFVVLFQI